jgi:hypothetical protein
MFGIGTRPFGSFISRFLKRDIISMMMVRWPIEFYSARVRVAFEGRPDVVGELRIRGEHWNVSAITLHVPSRYSRFRRFFGSLDDDTVTVLRDKLMSLAAEWEQWKNQTANTYGWICKWPDAVLFK